MQQTEQLAELGVLENQRVEAVVETLAMLNGQDESLAEVAHDARNMVTALDLYCDLLREPGVLATPFSHYGGELKLVAAASRRLIEKLAALDTVPGQESTGPDSEILPMDIAVRNHHARSRQWQNIPATQIDNLAAEVMANRNLLAALAGPSVAVTVDVEGGALPVRLTGEDLTRILVNLVKNAAEAMSAVGRIHISLWESCGDPGNAPWLTLNVEDNGPGISDRTLEEIFEAGKSPNRTACATIRHDRWPVAHRGLGLSITRSIVEAAGGLIHAANRDPVGACLQIELPVRNS